MPRPSKSAPRPSRLIEKRRPTAVYDPSESPRDVPVVSRRPSYVPKGVQVACVRAAPTVAPSMEATFCPSPRALAWLEEVTNGGKAFWIAGEQKRRAGVGSLRAFPKARRQRSQSGSQPAGAAFSPVVDVPLDRRRSKALYERPQLVLQPRAPFGHGERTPPLLVPSRQRLRSPSRGPPSAASSSDSHPRTPPVLVPSRPPADSSAPPGTPDAPSPPSEAASAVPSATS